MANCVLAFPNRVDDTSEVATAFSGGNWQSSLPLGNLKDDLLSNVARSLNDNLSSTNFDLDLGARRDIRVLGIPRHTISRSGKIRVQTSNTFGDFSTPTHDTGWSDVWPVVYPFGSLPFGHPSFWDGKLSQEEAEDYNIGWSLVLPAAINAQYWRFEIDDTANPKGFVDISRLFLAPGWQPTINMSYRNNLGWADDTRSERSLGGVEYFDRRDGRRISRFSIEYIPEDEAMSWPFEMQRLLGTDGQLYFIYNPDDTIHQVRRRFLARMERLSPISQPVFAHSSTSFQLTEVL